MTGFYDMMFQRVKNPRQRQLLQEIFSWISFVAILLAMISVAYDNFTYKESCIEKFRANCPCLVSPDQHRALISEFGDNSSYTISQYSNTSSDVS